MKKAFTLLSSLLILAGLKAQTVPPPFVKKETVKPGAIQPGIVTDTIKKIALKENSKAIKFDHIKKTPTVQMKETTVQMKETPVAKPHKG